MVCSGYWLLQLETLSSHHTRCNQTSGQKRARTFHARVLNKVFFVGSHCRMLMMKCLPNRFYLWFTPSASLSAPTSLGNKHVNHKVITFWLFAQSQEDAHWKSIHAKWTTTALTSLIVFSRHIFFCLSECAWPSLAQVYTQQTCIF